MRIDRLEIENFKKFKHQSLDLNPQFTLLVGDNGAGKTSYLDALSVALGIWHKTSGAKGWRNILEEEIRVEAREAGDRTFFEPQLPTKISASGRIGRSEQVKWTRTIKVGGTRTTNSGARDAEDAIRELVSSPGNGDAMLPVLAYYGAGRAWLPTNKRPKASSVHRKQQRLGAYDNCLDTRINDKDLNDWFLYEAAANGHGIERPGYRIVKQAVLACIPESNHLRYDSDRKEVVLSIDEVEQPFYNLSAGQRMMLAMVADIAIKAVTLNSFILGEGKAGAGDPEVLLARTPGVVLVDELDVHLHPKWQRRVPSDLKRVFPGIQFVCTSHSPQIIGELRPDEIRILEDDFAGQPPRSHGIDSSRILEEVMGAASRNEDVTALLGDLSEAIETDDLERAKNRLSKVEQQLGEDDPEVVRARTLMTFMESEA